MGERTYLSILLLLLAFGCMERSHESQFDLKNFDIKLSVLEIENLSTGKLYIDTIEMARDKDYYLHGFRGNLNPEDNFPLYSLSRIEFLPNSAYREYLFMLDKEKNLYQCVDTISHKIVDVKQLKLSGRKYKIIKQPNFRLNGQIGSYTFLCEDEGIMFSLNSNQITTVKNQSKSMMRLIDKIRSDSLFMSMN